MSPTPQGSETAEGNEMNLSELAEEEEQLLRQLQQVQQRRMRAVPAASAEHGSEQPQELFTTPNREPSRESQRRFNAVRAAQTARQIRESEMRVRKDQVRTGGSSSSGQNTLPVTLRSEQRRERFEMPDLGQTASITSGSGRTPEQEDVRSGTLEHPEVRRAPPPENPVGQDSDDEEELIPDDGNRLSTREKTLEEDNRLLRNQMGDLMQMMMRQTQDYERRSQESERRAQETEKKAQETERRMQERAQESERAVQEMHDFLARQEEEWYWKEETSYREESHRRRRRRKKLPRR